MLLNLKYNDETITTYDSEGTKLSEIVQKRAAGNEDSYSTSWLYVDSSYTEKGTACLTYFYPGQNEAFNELVADSFEIAALPFIPVLSPFEQISSIKYSPIPNYEMGETGPGRGYVGMTWWNVTEDGISQLVNSLESSPNAAVSLVTDFYHVYSIAIESDYFDSISIEYYGYNDDGTEPLYTVDCYIYYK